MLLAEPALIATIAWLPVDDLPSGMWANFWANVWSWQGLLVAFAIVGEILAVMFVYRVLAHPAATAPASHAAKRAAPARSAAA